MTQMTQQDLGNTKPNPSAKAKTLRSRKWCFTINNYDEKENDTITQLLSDGKYVVGEEKGEAGTPHLQGYVEYTSARTFASMKKLLPRAHIEKAKGNTKQNYDYCTKEGKFKTNMDFRTPTEKLHTICLESEYKDVEWKPWQREVLNILENKPDTRKIHWFWEPTGNIGKSYLCKYLALTRDVIICEGKKNDIFNQVLTSVNNGKVPSIILLDVPRTTLDYINYGAIESLKNGLIYSGKYEGGICAFPIPHIIAFANEEPDVSAMSADRWAIHSLH